MRGFRGSDGDSTNERVLHYLEFVYLGFRLIIVQRVTVIKFG